MVIEQLAVQCQHWEKVKYQVSTQDDCQQLSNIHTHTKSTECVEWPTLKIDLFLHISHQLGADGERMTLENRINKNKKHGVTLFAKYCFLSLLFFSLYRAGNVTDSLVFADSSSPTVPTQRRLDGVMWKNIYKSHYQQNLQHQACLSASFTFSHVHVCFAILVKQGQMHGHILLPYTELI